MKAKIFNTKIEIYDNEEIPKEYHSLIHEAKAQTQKAYAPYSNFKVGAVVLLRSGIVIGGNNQENIAYPSGLCAERVAVFYANSQYPDTAIEAIAIAAFQNGNFTVEPVSPCGACLQALLESEMRQQENIKLILYGRDNVHIISSIKECLPLSFHL